jgi:hypothetical protein
MSSAVATTNSPSAKAPRAPVQRKRKNPDADVAVAAAPVDAAPAVAAPAPAPATKATRAPRASKKAAAAVESAAVPVAVPVPVPAAAAPSTTVTKAPRKPRASKKAAVAAESENTPTAVDAPPAPASTDGESAAAPKKTQRAKPKTVYIEGYGDEHLDEKDQLYTPEAWEEWKANTNKRTSSQTYAQWKVQKKNTYKANRQDKSKKKKRATKKVDSINTSEKHTARLLAMPAEAFTGLNNVWLSTHGFDDKLSAEQLASIDKTTIKEGALQAYSVYQAAVAHGVRPLGIVSEMQKVHKIFDAAQNKEVTPDENDMRYQFTVEGETDGIPVAGAASKRVYVGVALPFKNKLASPFAVIPQDRVYADAGADSETA